MTKKKKQVSCHFKMKYHTQKMLKVGTQLFHACQQMQHGTCTKIFHDDLAAFSHADMTLDYRKKHCKTPS